MGVLVEGLAFTAGLAFVETTFGVGGFLAETGVVAGVALVGVFFTDFGVVALGVFFGDGDFVFGVATGGLGVSAIGGTVCAAFGVFFGLGSFGVVLFGVTALSGVFLPLGVAGFGVVLLGVSIFAAFFGETRFGVVFGLAGFGVAGFVGDTLVGMAFGVPTLGVLAFGSGFFQRHWRSWLGSCWLWCCRFRCTGLRSNSFFRRDWFSLWSGSLMGSLGCTRCRCRRFT